ncbi:plastocyanin/azurin family copper-binding protein [Rhodohalobacter sp. 8-1]|uniref:plastocyanin/azurin family copper-binding protein n=1 Tax=Rhodohalobacter sp. 8-1 TaxID=3131972 RepID=UPI0030EB2A10
MKNNTLIIRYLTQSSSLLLIAFSIVGLLNIDESKTNILEFKADMYEHPLPATDVNDSGSEKLIDNQESVFVADGDTAVVKSFGTDLSYDVTEIRAKAGSTITIRYENTSDMPHNIVFVNSRDDIQPVGVAGIRARDTGYVPMSDDMQERIFAYTDLAKPGTTVHVTLTVPDPGTYPYICSYPGHFTMMQGDLIAEE